MFFFCGANTKMFYLLIRMHHQQIKPNNTLLHIPQNVCKIQKKKSIIKNDECIVHI
uniref:Uncharacterized protein n=1 Tax=Setaria italica TaxID=4555 RepID=K3Y0T2_SETIT